MRVVLRGHNSSLNYFYLKGGPFKNFKFKSTIKPKWFEILTNLFWLGQHDNGVKRVQ